VKGLRRAQSGIGDAQLFVRYSGYQWDAPGKTFRIAPFVGTTLATGKDDARDAVGTLPPEVQLGTGNSAVFGGVVMSYNSLDWSAESQISFQNNNTVGGADVGDLVKFDTSLQYRLLPRKLGIDSTHFINGVIELNIANQNKNRRNNQAVNNSGGTQVFVAPEIQYITQRWIPESSLQIPVSGNRNALRTDLIA